MRLRLVLAVVLAGVLGASTGPAAPGVPPGGEQTLVSARTDQPDRGAARLTAADQTLDRLGARLDRMRGVVRGHERTRTRLHRWWRCVYPMRVDQVGDPEHRWGFEYDERDGTGLDLRSALVRREAPGRPDLLLLRFARSRGCASRAPDPNGTGADERRSPRSTAGGRVVDEPGSAVSAAARPWRELRRLQRGAERLAVRIDRLEAVFDDFDEWESCLSWLPVTEYGHAYQGLGYRFDGPEEIVSYRSALDIDDSEWDDPDYMLLAFLGRDRPFAGECGHEPGEGVDRVAGRPGRGDPQTEEWQDALDDLRDDLGAAQEDLEDLVEPAEEFIQFDECMFTAGVQNRGSDAEGYRFRNRTGDLVRRSALSFDMTGLQLPEMDVMAFPGEEPPSIECNEDAGGQSTDE